MPEFFAPEEPFETPELVLRGYRLGDEALMRDAVVSSYDHLRTFMPWAVEEQSLDEARALVRQFRGKWLLNQDFVVAIVSVDGSEFLGGCGYHLRNGPLEDHSVEMGMWIRASRAAQGVGFKAIQALIAWGFSAWPWERLTWRCDSRNHASRRIALKAGMLDEGTLRQDASAADGGMRDTDCFGLLKSEWAPA